jgi:dolichol-phosphate mannosyltransferase
MRSQLGYFLIPVFNEAENIPVLIENLRREGQKLGNFKLVFVDDGSTDNTPVVIRGYSNMDDIISLGTPKNQGPGMAFQIGFDWLLEHAEKQAFVFTLEGDNTADLTTLPLLIDALSESDLVLASVYSPGGSFSNTNFWRLGMSKLANLMTRYLLGIRQQTLTSFYRGWRLEFLAKMNTQFQPLILESGYICQVELLYKAKQAGARISEIPTRLHSDRRIGKSKMKLIFTAFQYGGFIFRTILMNRGRKSVF